MNDVKYLCEVTLDAEAPPLREAEQALAIAARSAARRDRVAAATVGLAGVTVVAALVTPALLPSHPPAATPAVAAPATVASTAASAAASAPSAQVPATHDRVVYDLLVAALPAGYTGRSQYPFATAAAPRTIVVEQTPPAGAIQLHMTVHVVVSDGHGEGKLWAYVAGDGRPVPTGDLCAEPDVGRDCRVLDVAGVPVAVWIESDGDSGDALVARRYLQGGHFDVIAQRSIPEYGDDTQLPPDAVKQTPSRQQHKPALTTAFIDAQQLAALAGNPAMLP